MVREQDKICEWLLITTSYMKYTKGCRGPESLQNGHNITQNIVTKQDEVYIHVGEWERKSFDLNS